MITFLPMNLQTDPPLTPPKRGIAGSDSPPLEGPGVGLGPQGAIYADLPSFPLARRQSGVTTKPALGRMTVLI